MRQRDPSWFLNEAGPFLDLAGRTISWPDRANRNYFPSRWLIARYARTWRILWLGSPISRNIAENRSLFFLFRHRYWLDKGEDVSCDARWVPRTRGNVLCVCCKSDLYTDFPSPSVWMIEWSWVYNLYSRTIQCHLRQLSIILDNTPRERMPGKQ